MTHVDDETTLCEVTQRKMTNMSWTCYDRLKDITVHLLCTLPPSARLGSKVTLYCRIRRLACFFLSVGPLEDQDTLRLERFEGGQYRSIIRCCPVPLLL